jgi:hypothetical protein
MGRNHNHNYHKVRGLPGAMDVYRKPARKITTTEGSSWAGFPQFHSLVDDNQKISKMGVDSL